MRRLLVIGLSILMLSVTQAVQAGEHYPACGAAANLKTAVNNANSNGESDYIGLAAEGCIYDLDKTLVIKADGGNPVTIEGNGAIISGVNAVQVFSVEPGATLILQNITIRHGKASTGGGAIRNSGTVTLTNAYLYGNTNNAATYFYYHGGAVHNLGNLSMTNSTLYDNHGAFGGGLYNKGTATITNSSIQGNTAVDSGGGIYQDVDSTLTIINSYITLNEAKYGGGVSINARSKLTLNGTLVAANLGKKMGGGVYNRGETSLTNSLIRTNNTNGQGGGIFNESGILKLTGSTLLENNAVQANGGGLFNATNGTANLTNTTVALNSANVGGGMQNEGKLSLTNATIVFNSASNSIGGLLNFAGTATLDTSILAYNSAGDCGGSATFSISSRNLVADGFCNLKYALSGDPGIGSLIGDPTFDPIYYPLLPGSKAIDTGSNSYCPGNDQRGAARPMDGDGDGSAYCDLGAYEADTVPLATPTLTHVPSATATPDSPTSTPDGTTTPTATVTPTAPVTSGVELLVNGDFELKDGGQKSLLDPWTLKNASGDSVKCNKPDKIVARTGSCALRFKGGASENAALVQSAAVDSFTFASGDLLKLQAFINASSPTVSGKVKLSVKYTDAALTADKVSVELRPTDGYEDFGGQATLKSGSVAKIKLQISHHTTSSKLYVDSVSLKQQSLEAELLPLP